MKLDTVLPIYLLCYVVTLLRNLWVPAQGLIHCLTHIIPDDELTGHHLDFASEYVRHALTQRFIQKYQTELRLVGPDV